MAEVSDEEGKARTASEAVAAPDDIADPDPTSLCEATCTWGRHPHDG